MGLRGPKPRRKGVAWSGGFAYAVGLMAADGNLSIDGRHMTFVSKDEEQIKALRALLDVQAIPTRKLSGREGDSSLYYRLQWGDVVLYEFFLSIGLMPNKSTRLGALDVPDPYFFDFLRGLFDGDGCFYSYFDPRWKSSYMFYLDFASGSMKHIAWLQRTVARLLGVHGHVASSKNKDSFHLRYAKKESLVVMRRMYLSAGRDFLKRKKLKISRALRIVGESLAG